MQWRSVDEERAPEYGPWNIEKKAPGPSLAALDKVLKEQYAHGIRAELNRTRPFTMMLEREIAKAEDDIREQLGDAYAQDIWGNGPRQGPPKEWTGLADFGGLPIIENKWCPPNTAYLINEEQLVVGQRMRKTRWWWKPWTWRRAAWTPEGWDWKQHFTPVQISGWQGYEPTLIIEDEIDFMPPEAHHDKDR